MGEEGQPKIRELERQCELVLERFERRPRDAGKIGSAGGEKKAVAQAQRSVAEGEAGTAEEMESACSRPGETRWSR